MARSLVGSYTRLAELRVEVDSYQLERLEQQVSSGFKRVTTVVRLCGGGEEGLGEDVTYDAVLHDSWPELRVLGSWTLDSFSQALDGDALFVGEPTQRAYLNYRRWGIESAALDLALRQGGVPLAEPLAREPRPVRFVVSTRLGEPPSVELLRGWLEHYPGLRFKLDPTSDWDDRVVAEVAALRVTDVIDLKGAYHGTPVDQPPDAAMYERVAAGLPEAWIEDPALTPATEAVLEPYHDRITWDAPIHSVDDVLALPFQPRRLNVKPSRFGSIRRLLDFYDFCEANRIVLYGGGQFELGPGRAQIQYLASLFHPDDPNDVAPGGFNSGKPQSGLPTTPLAPAAGAAGFPARD